MNKLLIVDGHNLLFQMFFGMPARIINRNGKAIQGTLGFVGALGKMIRMVGPTHLVVLFDGEHGNERSGVDEAYKANRTDYSEVEEDENPFSQLPDIYAALDAMNVRRAEIEVHEADDVVSAYAARYRGEMEIVIASMDSDFFQLIDGNVSVLRYRGEQSVFLDPACIREKLGVEPEQYADYKSLTGDNSDNIRGAEGVGPKTAAQLICQFGNLEEVLGRADEIAKPKIREAIRSDPDKLRRNYQIIKLDERAELPFDVGELAYRHDGMTTHEVLARIGLR